MVSAGGGGGGGMGPMTKENTCFERDLVRKLSSKEPLVGEKLTQHEEIIDHNLATAKIFISLSSDDGRGTAAGAAGAGGGEQKEEGYSSSSSPRGAGALAEYFSSLFDETFCSHKFKLVG